jgi:DNA helicase HerA-like ATPase
VVVLDPFGEFATVGMVGKHFEELVKAGAVSSKDYPFAFEVAVLAYDPEALKRRMEKRDVSVAKGKFSLKGVSDKWREFPDEKAVRVMGAELRDAVKSGRVLVIDGMGLGLEERRKLFSCCVEGLWSCRVNGSIEPFVFVVEEPEAVESELLERISSEGKKLGVLMCLLSQHPAGISGRVLSQMGCYFIGRMLDAGDLKSLGSVAGDKSAVLPKLKTGEWIINGISLGRPTKVLSRERYSLSI